MKKIILLIAALSMATQAPRLYAVDDRHPEMERQNKMMQSDAWIEKGGMGMMKQNMHKMMGLMKEIHSTKDTTKRKQLMHEHMQSMHEGMQMMRGMGGGMMMGMMDGNQGKDGMMAKGMGNQDTSQHHQMMEQRMDMMQMMMEQVVAQMMTQKDMMSKTKK